MTGLTLLNRPGQVHLADLTLLLSCIASDDPLADLNADGAVETSDPAIVAQNFG